MEEMPTRVQDRYQAIAAILDHATLSMRHNTDGGAWSEWLADLVILITKRYPSLLVEWQQDKEARVGRQYLPCYPQTRIIHGVWPFLHEYGLQESASIKTGLHFPQWPIRIPTRLQVDGQEQSVLAYFYLSSLLFTAAQGYLTGTLLDALNGISDSEGIRLGADFAEIQALWWFCMSETFPFSTDIIYRYIVRRELRCIHSPLRPEDLACRDDMLPVWLLKNMHEFSMSCLSEVQKTSH